MQDTGNQTTQDRAARRRIALIVSAAVLALLVLVTTAGSAPAACGVCHGDAREAMAATGHADTPCYDCHLDDGAWGVPGQKVKELTHMYPAAFLGRGVTGSSDTTSRDVCLACHADVLEGPITGSRFSIDHSRCATGPTCDACHSSTAHGTAVRWHSGPVMQECVSCHSANDAAISCETCHVDGGYGRPDDAAPGPWQVTHGANWREMHGLGDLEGCTTCHPGDYCTDCHGLKLPHPADFGATHGKSAIASPDTCAKCHASREEFCDGCHDMEMPHPEGFLPSHDTIAEGTEDGRCFACHAESDCNACHEAHVHPGGSTGVPVPWPTTPEGRRP